MPEAAMPVSSEAPSVETFRQAKIDPTVRRWLGAARTLASNRAEGPEVRDLQIALAGATDPWARTWQAALRSGEADEPGAAPEQEELARWLGIEPGDRVPEELLSAEPLSEEEVTSLELDPDLEEVLDQATRLADGLLVPWALGLWLLQDSRLRSPRPDGAVRFYLTPIVVRFGEGQTVELRRGPSENWWDELGPHAPQTLVLPFDAKLPLPQELLDIRPPASSEPYQWADEFFRGCPVLWLHESATAEAVRHARRSSDAPPTPAPAASSWTCPVATEGFVPERLRALLDGLASVHRLELVVDTRELALKRLGKMEDSSEPHGPDPVAVALAHLASRNRVAEAQPAVSDRPTGEDQLDTTPVAQALAWTLALRDTATPLCVGVFGSWGSGKSFLMHQIAQHLRERKATAPAGLRERFVERVRVIPFNAWTYAKGDLWSALLFELLSALREERDLPQSDRLESVVTARQELAEKQEELAEKQAELARKRNDAERRLTASETLERLYHHRVELLGKEVEEKRKDLGAVGRRALLAAAKALIPWVERPEKRRWALFFLALLGIALLGSVAFLWGSADLWKSERFGPFFGRLSAVAAAVAGALAALTGPVKRAAAELKPAWEAFQRARERLEVQVATVQERWQEIESEVGEERRKELVQVESEVAALETEVEVAASALRSALDRYGTPVARRDLKAFLDARLEQGDYLERLGPLQRVEQDLKELAVILAAVKEGAEEVIEPAPPRSRIVLMIDDLDRCPPDKVVVVLEATQLLLAENIYLGASTGWPFVVVLGADTRVLTRALEKEYEGILSPYDSPTGLDYLEKIIQIPYRVPAVDERRYTRYLEKLTGISREAAQAPAVERTTASETEGRGGGPRNVEPPELEPLVWDLTGEQPLLTSDDLEVLDRHRLLAPDHPRGIKRVLNQYRLAKVLGMGTGRFAPSETAFLLNLAGGFPWTARELVSRLQTREVQGDLLGLLREIRATLEQSQRNRSVSQELDVLLARVEKEEDQFFLPDPGRLRAVLPDVAPFCFVSGFTERGGM